jgi:hypothetical protein
MSDDQIGPILLMATSAAMSARTGQLQPHQVADLRAAATALPVGHPLRFGALAFCLGWDLNRRDADAVAALGEALERDVARALRPDPIDRTRSDIHG